jgi:glycerol uptake facilitator protein
MVMKTASKDECISEIIGTFILILIGTGVVASVELMGRGDSFTVDVAWGMAVAFGAMAAKKSGGHLNPAVTVGLWLGGGGFPAAKVLPYIIAQFIGAFLGAVVVFIMYYPEWIVVDPELTKAGIFTTFPSANLTTSYAIFDQAVETALLLFGIIIIGNNINSDMGGFLGPLLVGLLVMTIGLVFAPLHGYAINPARDLAPRLFVYLMDFKNVGFSDPATWLAPVIGPFIGGVVGVITGIFTIKS